MPDAEKQNVNFFKRKYNRKDADYFGMVLAFIFIAAAIVVPLLLTNNEVRAAEKAVEEAAKIAFEEAKMAALKESKTVPDAPAQEQQPNINVVVEKEAASDGEVEKLREEISRLADEIATLNKNIELFLPSAEK